MTVGLDIEDLQFLREAQVLKSDNDGIRFALRFLRLYGIPALRAIKDKEIT